VNERIKDKLEWLRLVTPILVTIGIFLMTNIMRQLEDIDAKLFKHLTNDEMHCPRSLTVMKPEFLIYQNMRDKQMDDMREGLRRVENTVAHVADLMERHIEQK
jgi:hypothetical protein